MKFKGAILIVFTLMLAIVQGKSLTAQETLIAKLTVATGKVELKRQGWEDYRQTHEGVDLLLGDLLKVERGSTAVIQCTSDATEWTVPADGLPWGVAIYCRSPE